MGAGCWRLRGTGPPPEHHTGSPRDCRAACSASRLAAVRAISLSMRSRANCNACKDDAAKVAAGAVWVPSWAWALSDAA